jgi:Protein of unknown function (DUF3168)
VIDFFALQTALYDRMKNDDILAAQVSGIYDYVPDATSYPYVLFDALQARRDSAVDLSRRLVVEQTVRAYSNDADIEKGWAQVRNIATALFLLFDFQVLMVNGSRLETVVSQVNILRAEGTARAALVVIQIWFA